MFCSVLAAALVCAPLLQARLHSPSRLPPPPPPRHAPGRLPTLSSLCRSAPRCPTTSAWWCPATRSPSMSSKKHSRQRWWPPSPPTAPARVSLHAGGREAGDCRPATAGQHANECNLLSLFGWHPPGTFLHTFSGTHPPARLPTRRPPARPPAHPPTHPPPPACLPPCLQSTCLMTVVTWTRRSLCTGWASQMLSTSGRHLMCCALRVPLSEIRPRGCFGAREPR